MSPNRLQVLGLLSHYLCICGSDRVSQCFVLFILKGTIIWPEYPDVTQIVSLVLYLNGILCVCVICKGNWSFRTPSFLYVKVRHLLLICCTVLLNRISSHSLHFYKNSITTLIIHTGNIWKLLSNLDSYWWTFINLCVYTKCYHNVKTCFKIPRVNMNMINGREMLWCEHYCIWPSV